MAKKKRMAGRGKKPPARKVRPKGQKKETGSKKCQIVAYLDPGMSEEFELCRKEFEEEQQEAYGPQTRISTSQFLGYLVHMRIQESRSKREGAEA